MRVRSSGVRRVRGRALLVVMIIIGSVGFVAAPAHAASKVHEQVLLDFPPGTNIPDNSGEPGCTHASGITVSGKIWVDTYVNYNLLGVEVDRWNKMRWYLSTSYRKATATAAVAYADLYGRSGSCAELNQFDGRGDTATLRAIVCGSHLVTFRANRWCQLQARADVGAKVPAQTDLNVEACRQPRWNYGQAGPFGYASWHNMNLFIEKRDLQEHFKVGWFPGHININTYFDDFDMLMGVDPWVTGKPTGYGKVQTAQVSEWVALWYDAIAHAIGQDPNAAPVSAWNAVDTAVANNRLVPGVGRLRAAHDKLQQAICDVSPWLQDALDDSPGGEVIVGPCDAGFEYSRKESAAGVRYMIQWFVASQNNGVVPEPLKGGQGLVIPMIIRSAYKNQGAMAVRDPLSKPTGCAVKLDLGTGRNTHFVKLFGNLANVLGG